MWTPTSTEILALAAAHRLHSGWRSLPRSRLEEVSVVTDEIDKFTKNGIRIKSGEVLQAVIIITATGFNLNALGDIDFVIDGKPLVFSDTITYRGTMFTGVPNMAWVFGYFRASWTFQSTWSAISHAGFSIT